MRYAIAVSAGIIASFLTACSGPEAVTGSATPEKTAPAASPPPSSPAPERAPEEATAPGTRLKLGDKAVLPHRKGVVGVTVISVKAGNKGAFRRQFGRRAQGIDPYYIRYAVENIDGGDLAFASPPILHLETADGRSSGAVVSGSIGGCKRASAPKDFTRAGVRFKACRLAGARAGVKIVGAKFTSDDYRDDPVVWRR